MRSISTLSTPRLTAVFAVSLWTLSACQPLPPEEQARLRGEAPAVAAAPAPVVAAADASIVAEPLSTTLNLPAAEPIGASGYRDDFNRAELGADWFVTGGEYSLQSNQLFTRATGNHGLWLRRKLPRDVRIEFKVRAEGTGADIKLEVFGDGQSPSPKSGYIVIFGGWSNTLNVIARLNEIGADRAVGPSRPIIKGKTYRMRIERRGKVIEAFADDVLLARLDDPQPLEGPGHEFFAMSGWQSELWYDELVITPLR